METHAPIVKTDERTLEQIIDSMRCIQYVDAHIVKTAPKGKPGEEDVLIIRPDRNFETPEELESYCDENGYELVEPNVLGKMIEADPGLADQHPIATQWDVRGGASSYAVFRRWHGRRSVDVRRYGHGWGDGVRFAVRRKRK